MTRDEQEFRRQIVIVSREEATASVRGTKLRSKKYESSRVTINPGIHVKKYSGKVFMICSLWQGSFLIPSKNPLRHSPCFGAPKIYLTTTPHIFDSRAEFYENKKISTDIHQHCLLSGVKTVLIKSRLPSSFPHCLGLVRDGKKTTAKWLGIAFAKSGQAGHCPSGCEMSWFENQCILPIKRSCWTGVQLRNCD